MNSPNLHIMVGLSASGKSSVAKELQQVYNGVIISSDDIRGEICEGGVIDQSKNDEVFKIFHKRIRENLQQGGDVIADATNITIKARKSIFENVKQINCNKIAHIMTKNVGQCIEDNVNREYPVPHHVILKQMMNYQLPFYEEGFDGIIVHKYHEEIEYNFLMDTIDSMKGYDQNNPYHNDTLDVHCKKVRDLFEKMNYPSHLLLSAQIHDIGKLYTRKTDENGISHYYQHENVGTYYLLSNFANLLACTGLYTTEVLEMLFLINYHMLPIRWKTATNKTINKWKSLLGEHKFSMLLDFNTCDKSR